MDLLSKREPIIRAVAEERGLDPELVLDLIRLEQSFPNLHAYGARGKMRRAAEALMDKALAASKRSGEK